MRCRVVVVVGLFPATLLGQRGGGRVQGDPTLTGPIPASAPAYGPALFEAMRIRNVGPTTGGRIADIAVDPKNESIWYVASAASGLWKTTSHGVSFTPIFDSYGSFSLGCVVIDPNNSNVIWLGTGENNAQRSVDFGDGVYKSTDAGKTWANVGLSSSEHIAKILVDPRNSDVVYVAAQGPLWSAGGDRGLYKTTDGGKTWNAVLTISENTGVSDAAFDPRNPDVLYAASWQRRRHVGMALGGGPESGIFKSTDAGRTWMRLRSGLPTVNVGRIGLAVSPQNGDVVYAWLDHAAGARQAATVTVAAVNDSTTSGQPAPSGARGGSGGRVAGGGGGARGGRGVADPTMGFYRSADGGATWTRMADAPVQEPQYYGEVFTDPHKFDRVYFNDMNMKYSDDGGKTIRQLPANGVHVDYHVLWADPKDDNHLIVGSDGGLYESYDWGQSWRHFAILSMTQFYRIGVDNAWPFYNVNGGAQDNGSQAGPTRSPFNIGIRGSDWFSTGGGDGMQARIDPDDPDMLYSQTQSSADRLNKLTGETESLRPVGTRTFSASPGPGGGGGRGGRMNTPNWNMTTDTVRWHWDTPLYISPFNSSRLYTAGSSVFRSDDKGHTWTKISGDLTKHINRDTLPIMGRLWADSEAVLRNASTNDYGTGMAFDESPLKQGLIWWGSDDNVVAWSDNDGKNWTRITTFPDVPSWAQVTDIVASRHDVNTAYVSFTNYSRGDYKPYVLKTTDRGKTWTSIAGDLPDRQFVWSLAEDHVNKNLLFAGTEFGLFFTVDGGRHWTQLHAGLPTIAVRDIEVQRRENDLVLGTFGRGVWVLDDYSPLRSMTPEVAAQDVALLPMRNALQFPTLAWARGAAGDANDLAPNPMYGALINYYIKDTPSGALLSGSDSLLVATIKDAKGKFVRDVPLPAIAGLHRVAWTLRGPPVPPQPQRRDSTVDQRPVDSLSTLRRDSITVTDSAARANAARGGQGGGGAGAGGGGRGGAAGAGGFGPGGFGGGTPDNGPLVAAGRYTVTLQHKVNGKLEQVGQPQSFEVFVVDPVPRQAVKK
jgi:photosystem II stability/assembly factor-like uncharacterized protein